LILIGADMSFLAGNGLDWCGSKFEDKIGEGRDSSGKWFVGVKFGGVKDLVKLEVAREVKLKGSGVNSLYDLEGW
jgi:hypothetical protein